MRPSFHKLLVSWESTNRVPCRDISANRLYLLPHLSFRIAFGLRSMADVMIHIGPKLEREYLNNSFHQVSLIILW